MRRSTRNKKEAAPSKDTGSKQKAKPPQPKQKLQPDHEDSSSESDIENYLQSPDQIDLNSTFFQTEKSNGTKSFESIEKDIFAGADRLSDSESEESNHTATAPESQPTTSKLNFTQLHNYTQKIEEAKRIVKKYEAKKKPKEKQKPKDDDISNLLALGEMQVNVPDNFRASIHSSDFDSCSESEKEDWEEVPEDKAKPSTSFPKDGIQITVALPDNMKKKKGVDLVACMKRRLNRIKKENQILIHKVHLLCWLAHGNYVNKILNSESVLALSLSLIPSQHCYPPNRTDLNYLEQITDWYTKVVVLVEKSISKQWSFEKVLKLQLTRKAAYNKKMLVYLFICILRSLGIQCRLVLSLQVLPLRPPNSELHSVSSKIDDKNVTKSHEDKKKINLEKTEQDKAEKPENKDRNVKHNKSVDNTKLKPEKMGKGDTVKKRITKGKSSKTSDDKNSDEKQKLAGNLDGKVPKKKRYEKDKESTKHEEASSTKKSVDSKAKKPNLEKLGKTTSSQSKRTKNNKAVPQLDGVNDSSDDSKPGKSSKPKLKKLSLLKPSSCPKNHPKRLKSLPNYTERNSDEDFAESGANNNKSPKTRTVNIRKLRDKSKSRSSQNLSTSPMDIRNDIISIMKNRMKQEKDVSHSKLVKGRKSKTQSDDDSDYAPEPIKKKYDSDDDDQVKKVKVKRRVQVKKSDEPEKTKKGIDMWVEVFLEAEEKWISVDVCKNQVHCVHQLYSRASHPVSYIIAWDNNNSIKDITQRYCTNWNTTTRKLRIDNKWWNATLKPYVGQKTIRDKEEDEELAQLQLDKPLPGTISEYKHHPLYVLKRHLLKFEALYPPNPPPLGFVRNEPVYARDCVHVLHSREIWIKHAKVVKPGETPYKIVKARPKYDRSSGNFISDLPLEVFGIWQVDEYIPPTAENGIVPRNAYGNVELFKPSMLPKGTVHLQLPGLNKVARKMNIDCASAVVGFDFHGGWNHPTYDGFIVCEEHSEILIAAWYTEQEEQEKREVEKVEKRVYGNWRKLIKGLLIRERLKARYDYGAPSQSEAQGKKRKSKAPKFVAKKRRLCSDSESD